MKAQSTLMLLSRRYRLYYNKQAGGWYVDYSERGQRVRQTLGVKTKPEAEAAVMALDKRNQPALLIQGLNTEQKARQTLDELSCMFLEYKTSMGKAPKTVVRYRSGLSAFGRYMKSKGHIYADEVTLQILDGYYAYRINTEKRRVATAFGDSLGIKGMFKWASKKSRGLLAENPALDWETPKPVTAKRRCYSRAEVERMEREVRPWLREVVSVLAWTGMRIGELINLKWSDVDLKQKLIHVRIRDDWRPKGKADRTIPMHPKVAAIVAGRPVRSFVFYGPNGGKLKEQHCLEALKSDQRKLGLPVSDLHGLRRFFATEMLRVGVDLETVRQWGGWKTLETMLRYLADVTEGRSVKVMEEAAAKLAAS
jgi:integrase